LINFSDLNSELIGRDVKITTLKHTRAGESLPFIEKHIKEEEILKIADVDKNWTRKNTILLIDSKDFTFWVSHKDIELI